MNTKWQHLTISHYFLSNSYFLGTIHYYWCSLLSFQEKPKFNSIWVIVSKTPPQVGMSDCLHIQNCFCNSSWWTVKSLWCTMLFDYRFWSLQNIFGTQILNKFRNMEYSAQITVFILFSNHNTFDHILEKF